MSDNTSYYVPIDKMHPELATIAPPKTETDCPSVKEIREARNRFFNSNTPEGFPSNDFLIQNQFNQRNTPITWPEVQHAKDRMLVEQEARKQEANEPLLNSLPFAPHPLKELQADFYAARVNSPKELEELKRHVQEQQYALKHPAEGTQQIAKNVFMTPSENGIKQVYAVSRVGDTAFGVSYTEHNAVVGFDLAGVKWNIQADGSYKSKEEHPRTFNGKVEIDNWGKYGQVALQLKSNDTGITRYYPADYKDAEVWAHDSNGKTSYSATTNQANHVTEVCGYSQDGLSNEWRQIGGSTEHGWKGHVELDKNDNLRLTPSAIHDATAVWHPDGSRELYGIGQRYDQLTRWSLKISPDGTTPEDLLSGKVSGTQLHNVEISVAPNADHKRAKTVLEVEGKTIKSGKFFGPDGNQNGEITINDKNQLVYNHPCETDKSLQVETRLENASFSEKDGVITLETADDKTIRLSPDGSRVDSMQINGKERPIMMLDATGTKFEYRWDSSSNDMEHPSTVFIHGPASGFHDWQYDYNSSSKHYSFRQDGRDVASTTSISVGELGISASKYLQDGATIKVGSNGELILNYDSQTLNTDFGGGKSVITFNTDGTQNYIAEKRLNLHTKSGEIVRF